jgi:splicing factor 3A subunit 3
MVLEEQRGLHEDLERLEQAIADRVIDDPKNVSCTSTQYSTKLTRPQIRERLNRDHQVASFLDRIHDQSQRLLAIYKDSDGSLAAEVQKLSTGDPFEAFYREYGEIKAFHQRYPNEPVENLERAYKRRAGPGPDGEPVPLETDSMFTGEEGNGRFFDLTQPHDRFINLPGVRGARRLTYLQYLDAFDVFAPPACPVKRGDKMTDEYFSYLGMLVEYLEGFLRRIRPLDDLDRLIASFDADFEKAWDDGEVVGWEKQTAAGPANPAEEGDSIWCDDCEREFKSASTYQHHLSQKKHLRAAQARKARAADGSAAPAPASNGSAHANGAAGALRLKEKAVAAREQRVARLAAAMQTERADTRVNVERRQGMTEREREQELEALLAADDEARADAAAQAAADGAAGAAGAEDGDEDPDAKIYNPLKLPLGWDGKPIPFWLYKLHGLGVELACEVCGNFVYMGRRAFDKHFNEPRHVYGLRCLGITGNTTLFRDITGINDALKLWDKMSRDKKKEKNNVEGVVQMEDGEGNVMPEKVYNDLRKQGLL